MNKINNRGSVKKENGLYGIRFLFLVKIELPDLIGSIKNKPNIQKIISIMLILPHVSQ